MNFRPLYAAAVLAGAGCSADDLTSPESGPPSFALLPRGFGLFSQPGNSSAAAITDGISGKCSVSDDGLGRYALTLTPRIINDARAFFAAGGTASLRVLTTTRFIGAGDLRVNQTIAIRGPATSASYSKVQTASDPGHVNFLVLSVERLFPLTQADFVAGGKLEVTLTGSAFASLPRTCLQVSGGLATWKYTSPILKLEP